jgi:hypothetical protein
MTGMPPARWRSAQAIAIFESMATAIAVSPLIMIAGLLAFVTLAASGAHAQDAAPATELEGLIQQFDGTPSSAEGSVHLDAWIEPGTERDQVVVVVEPRGDFKLVADPGITVTPTTQPGVEWLVPLPLRLVDRASQYLQPPATLRLPFRADGETPLEILVEYAYCLVEFQCFLAEKVLRVTAR